MSDATEQDPLAGDAIGTAGLSGAATPDSPTLSGRMGTGSLTLTVLAFSAPIAVVSGYIPFSIYFGGTGAAFAFVCATAILLLFSVGYVAMTKNVPKPGDFYSFISTGLGKVTGLGAAIVAVLSYLVLIAGVYAQLGVTMENLLISLDGPDSPWLLWSVVGWAIVSVLGYFHIEISAKILTVAMLLEVVVVMSFNIAALAKGGPSGRLPSEPLNAHDFFAYGDVGVAMLFAILVFLGFESTALFRDEVKSPNRTIPRATYTAVIFVGLLYTLSCYLLMSVYGGQAVEVATNSPTTMFPDAIGEYVAPAFTQLTYVFVTTSLLAALLAIHNVVSRYLHNLGFDGALPTYLGAVHERHGSPHRASGATAVIGIAVLLGFTIAGGAGAELYVQLTGLGSVGILSLMALVSVSVIAWFARTGIPAAENSLKVIVAPAIAAVALAGSVILAITHFELLVGGEPGQRLWMVAVLAIGMLFGVGLALHYRARHPKTYDRLGRADRIIDVSRRE